MNIELENYKKYVNFNCNFIADVGSNEGVMTQFFLDNSSNARILCIEPHNSNINILKNKFLNNERVKIYQGAISLHDGECQIGLETQQRVNGLKQAHVLSNNKKDLQEREWNNNLLTQSWKLETLCKDCEIIKMDIEGFEHKILYNSLDKLINNKIFLLEIHSWEDLKLHGWNSCIHIHEYDSLNKMIKLFKKNNYKSFIPSKTHNLKKTEINEFTHWKDVKLSSYHKDGTQIYYKVINLIISK